MGDYQLLKKIILGELMNTKKDNSLDNEGANVAFCRLFMNRKSVRS